MLSNCWLNWHKAMMNKIKSMYMCSDKDLVHVSKHWLNLTGFVIPKVYCMLFTSSNSCELISTAVNTANKEVWCKTLEQFTWEQRLFNFIDKTICAKSDFLHTPDKLCEKITKKSKICLYWYNECVECITHFSQCNFEAKVINYILNGC